MSTTFVLHGGNASQKSIVNDKFLEEFTNLVDKPSVRILLCYWAREREKWDSLFARDKLRVTAKTDKKVFLSIAYEVEDVLNPKSDYDVLYVDGGDADLIEPYYKKLIGLRESLWITKFISEAQWAPFWFRPITYFLLIVQVLMLRIKGLGFYP